MLFQWHTDRLAEQRLHRDIVEIGRRAYESKMHRRNEFFQSRFEQVFGFKPELGEPVVDEAGKHSYWVQGFLFTADYGGVTQSKLCVRTATNGWTGVSDPAEFFKLLDRGMVVASD